MAVSLPRAPRTELFERHIRRLGWYMLIGSLALLIPVTRLATPTPIDLSLLAALGATIVVVTVFTVIRDVGRFVRQEQVRRREAAYASRRVGACQAAARLQDRIANFLSLTVGYTELLAEAEQLSPLAREQADKAVSAAMAASRAVSTFKESLGCAPELDGWLLDGPRDRSSVGSVDRRLSAEAQTMWSLLGDTQHLGARLLADSGCNREAQAELQTLLERINTLATRLEA
jgi:hypothetical protein